MTTKKTYAILACLLSLLSILFCISSKPIASGDIEIIEETEIEILPEYTNVMASYSDYPYSDSLAHYIYTLCEYYNIPEEIIYSIIYTESDFNIQALSYMDCRGLMQISVHALNHYNTINNTDFTMEDLYNPMVNVSVGIWYYAYLLDFLKCPDYEYGYIAYNIGPGNYLNNLNYYIEGSPIKRFREKNKEIKIFFNPELSMITQR